MDLTNYLRKDFATPSIYYGYSSDSNAASTDFNWSIRKVTTATNVETVTWSNGDPGKPYTKWNDRVASFATPTGSLGLTCSLGTQINNNIPLNITWNQLSGVNRYQIVVSSNSIIYSDSGNQIYNNPNFNNSQITKEIVNGGSYTFNYAESSNGASSSNVYSITLTAINVAGSSASTITVNT
jgi:hypothetical protein